VTSSIGRPAQRRRTRAALLAAAATLIEDGQTPSTTEVADAAGVSRRTAYRYFPTQEQLLVEAALERFRPQVEAAMQSVGSVAGRRGTGSRDVDAALARLDAAARIMHRLALEHEPLLRTMQRLTAAGATARGVRPRGTRRIDWLTEAVEPIRGRLGPRQFERLISALASCVGFDALFLLRDVRGVSTREAERVTRWTARALLLTSLAEAPGRSAGGGTR